MRLAPLWLSALVLACVLCRPAQAQVVTYDYATSPEYIAAADHLNLTAAQRDDLDAAVRDCGISVDNVFGQERPEMRAILLPSQRDVYEQWMGQRKWFDLSLMTPPQFLDYRHAMAAHLALTPAQVPLYQAIEAHTLTLLEPVQIRFAQRFEDVLTPAQLALFLHVLTTDYVAYLPASQTQVVEQRTETVQQTTETTTVPVRRSYAVKVHHKSRPNWRNQDLK